MHVDIINMVARQVRAWWKLHSLLLLAALTVFVALTGCGNGGGGSPTPGTATSVTGRILRAENNAPEAGTTVKIGSQTTTSAQDGTFAFASVDATTKTAAVTPAAPAMPRTLPLALNAHASNNLGDIYVSDTGYNASVNGTVVAQINGARQTVGNATVTIAGAQVKSGTDGTFKIDNLPVGLGSNANASIGTISAPNFESKPIFTQFPLATGSNDLGTLLLGAPVSTTPPGVPYTITGTVNAGGQHAVGANITLTNSGGQLLGTTTTDANGSYFFWVVTGQYTVGATINTNTQSVQVMLQTLDTPATAPVINF